MEEKEPTNISPKISPFEFKDELVKLASSQEDVMMLNAGRGNPNFLATLPRRAFIKLGEFAIIESERSYSYLEGLFGGMAEKEGIVGRFDQYCMLHEGDAGVEFLKKAVGFANDHLGIEREELIHEFTAAYLGCNYPFPPRMLVNCEKLVKRYIKHELFPLGQDVEQFDLFATEGGTASMTYLFSTMMRNGLLQKGDTIALLTPIFSPYLEIPLIPEFSFKVVNIQADETKGWQVPASELKKLEDQKIKLLCMVNPSNPPSVKMSDETLEGIKNIVEKKNKDLMIITDDVYATFAEDFESIFARCPRNTALVYSFSKYFGATGWRIGVTAIHKENVFDDLISRLDDKEKERLDIRYESLTREPRKVTFIDRMVADSRTVALNHTAGISLPQQLQMTLFALSSMIDDANVYRKAAKSLIHQRYELLLHSISPELKLEIDPENLVGYYAFLDLPALARSLHDDKFADFIVKSYSGAEFLKRLAKETGVVLLPGKGFGALRPTARVSLANLKEHDYKKIGESIFKILAELKEQYKDS